MAFMHPSLGIALNEAGAPSSVIPYQKMWETLSKWAKKEASITLNDAFDAENAMSRKANLRSIALSAQKRRKLIEELPEARTRYHNRWCKHCGKIFWSTSKNSRICAFCLEQIIRKRNAKIFRTKRKKAKLRKQKIEQ